MLRPVIAVVSPEHEDTPMSKLLLVEDDHDVRELLDLQLTAAGFEVWTAEDGESALLTAARMRPDAVLLDWMLPRVNGLDVCRVLRSVPRFEQTPIIMISSRRASWDIEQAMVAGATHYLTKPLTVRDAFPRIKAVIERAAQA